MMSSMYVVLSKSAEITKLGQVLRSDMFCFIMEKQKRKCFVLFVSVTFQKMEGYGQLMQVIAKAHMIFGVPYSLYLVPRAFKKLNYRALIVIGKIHNSFKSG